jgi:hypothetical protein
MGMGRLMELEGFDVSMAVQYQGQGEDGLKRGRRG